MRMIRGMSGAERGEGNSRARVHGRIHRYSFEGDVIEHMMEAQHGVVTATAKCIKDFASLAEPAFADMQILLRDEFINQITSGESAPKSNLDVATTGHSSRHFPHALLPVIVVSVHRRHI